MSTKAAMATEATITPINFTLAASKLNNGQVISYYFPEPTPNLVAKSGAQVSFKVIVPPGLVPASQVAAYITFTGTNSLTFSATDPIPWPFLPTESDPTTGYQIVLPANVATKPYTIRADTSRSVVSYSYSVYVKVQASTISGGSGGTDFYEFREDPEIYVDEC